MECLELNYQRLKNLNKDSAEEIIQKIMSKVLEDYTTLENKDFQGKLINSNNTNYGIEIIKHNRWEGEEYSDEKTKTEIGYFVPTILTARKLLNTIWQLC